MRKILFVGVSDFILRNLLRSSFTRRARELSLKLHALVYPDSFPVFREMMERELGMTSEPLERVRLSAWGLPTLERLAYRSSLYRAGRVRNHTYKAYRRQYWVEGGGGLRERVRLELNFLAGRIGGILGKDEVLARQYYQEMEKASYVRQVCIPRLKELDPTLLVSASPETFYDVPWMVAAGVLGIPRTVWIRSWDNITSKITMLPEAETYLVWSSLMAQELRQYFPKYADRAITEIGALQFDGHRNPANLLTRDDFCTRVGLEPGKPIVLYSTGGPHVFCQEHLLVHDLQKMVSEMPRARRPQILVRLHPYTWNTDLRPYEQLRDVCLWPPQEDAAAMAGGSTTGLIDDYKIMLSSFHHQAVNVNMFSTVTLDSSVLDRPVVNVAYDGPRPVHPFLSAKRGYRLDHYRPVVESGGVDVAYSYDELREALEQALVKPDLRRQERQKLVRLICGKVDGRAGERFADAIASYAGAESTDQPSHARECTVAG